MLKGVNRSHYSKLLPRQFIRIRLKIEKRCQFVLEHFFNVKMHVFFIVFYFQAQDACQMCKLTVGLGVR